MSQYLSKIIQPVITEKATELQKVGQYGFLVAGDATKGEVKAAIHHLYGVKVARVNITRLPAKNRVVGRGRVRNKRGAMKKATVTLVGRKAIDLYKFKAPKKKDNKDKDVKKDKKEETKVETKKVEAKKTRPEMKGDQSTAKGKKFMSFFRKSA